MRMDIKSINFNKLLKTFRNMWVATSDDYGKVFAHARTLTSLTKKLKGMSGLKTFLVIPFGMSYSTKS